jgi:predicted AAA+ superfamily ATPase
VDLVLKFQTGAIVGIEVKAGKMLSDSDFRGLRMLREDVGSDFYCGILMYQLEFSFRNADGLIALPADRLWLE